IRRMTALPAWQFNLAGRGMVREGFYADLVLLDPERFESKGTYGCPNMVCSGIRKVFVNGNLALDDGEILRSRQRSGRFLRVR
ncbi:MAG: D-aminoacylase, partial [Lentisphaeria bacterium]|nr:D-aminoacylase [Lentisphaeria bacterium]